MDEKPHEFARPPIQMGSPVPAERKLLVSVVVPCMNEQEVLKQTHAQLVAVLERAPVSFEIIYVDDGSTDSTAEILRELQRAG